MQEPQMTNEQLFGLYDDFNKDNMQKIDPLRQTNKKRSVLNIRQIKFRKSFNLIKQCYRMNGCKNIEKIKNKKQIIKTHFQLWKKWVKYNQLGDKILRDVKIKDKIRQQYKFNHPSGYDLQTLMMIIFFKNLIPNHELNYQFYEKKRRKYLSKVQHNLIQPTEDPQNQIVKNYIHGQSKNFREQKKDIFQKKRHFQQPNYLEEKNTIN
ncbi:unnamed protein product [Paramecium sonneborni]|uniref:Uncharacterized protein n=1 Tax=Paramecium sonneborni TaxID=65129 RepID=A0A8S1M1H1_9CILI|nr:unnamed protein product [Paramecium sonneborni]